MAKKRADIFDQAPVGAADLSEAGPVIKDGGPNKETNHEQQQAAIDAMAGTEVSIFATAPAWQPHPTLAEIAKLKEESLLLLSSSDLSTKAGYEAVKAYSVAIMRKRTAVDARRLEVTRQARDYVTQANSVGKTVINKLREIEEPLDAALEAQDNKAMEEARAEARRIEEEQRRKEDERLALIKAEEDRKKAEAQAELDKQRAVIEEQRKALEAQQAEFNRQQAELREAQEKVRLENERLQREAQAVLDAERKRVEDAKQEERLEEEAAAQAKRREEEETRRAAQAEQERIATEARVKKEREEAAALAVKNEQARVAREEEAKRVKEEKEAAAALKRAERAPDREKITAWLLDLQACTAPKVKSKEYAQMISQACIAIESAIRPLMNTVAHENEVEKGGK